MGNRTTYLQIRSPTLDFTFSIILSFPFSPPYSFSPSLPHWYLFLYSSTLFSISFLSFLCLSLCLSLSLFLSETLTNSVFISLFGTFSLGEGFMCG